MNASDKHVTGCPVENIFWEHPPKGKYRLWVENNTQRNDGATPFAVRLTKDGKSQTRHSRTLRSTKKLTSSNVRFAIRLHSSLPDSKSCLPDL